MRAGGRLHYVEKGAGDVALFVHGIWANHVLWEQVMASLPDTVRAIAPDWPLGSQPDEVYGSAARLDRYDDTASNGDPAWTPPVA